MDKNILRNILQLDSLVNVLSWYERIILHRLISDQKAETSDKIIELYNWIITENWQSPERNYGQDRVLYFYDVDSETWLPDDHYLKINTQYKPFIYQLKYKTN